MKLFFYVKQLAKMAMQQLYMPAVYKKAAKNQIEKGLVIFADAHHTHMPFSMEKMYETMKDMDRYHIEEHVTDFGKLGIGSLFRFIKSFMKRYAVAEYVFICDNFLPVSSCAKRTETKVIQLWHSGGLLKKSGYDTAEDIPKMYKGSVYKNYDLLTVSAPCCVPVFTHTMRLPEGVVRATGISRSDFYFQEDWNRANVEDFYRVYPEAEGKKIILWAPTFRGNAAMPTLAGMDMVKKAMEDTKEEFFWIIKLHPHLEGKGMTSNCAIPTEKLFAVADIMVTDYSSVLFDYLSYKKPFVFFAPDYQEYDSVRGFYVDYNSFPTTVVTEGEGLVPAIRKELACRPVEDIEKCYEYHMAGCDGRATERIMKTAGIL